MHPQQAWHGAHAKHPAAATPTTPPTHLLHAGPVDHGDHPGIQVGLQLPDAGLQVLLWGAEGNAVGSAACKGGIWQGMSVAESWEAGQGGS